MKKVYVFRHGQTTANVEQTRDVNPPLTELGREQAFILGNLLKDKNIRYLYSSYMDRANATAKIVGSVVGVENVEIMGGLEEVDQGILKGRPKNLLVGLPENYQDLVSEIDTDIRYPGGESKLEVRARILQAVLRAAKQTYADNVGIGSHGFAMRELMAVVSPENYERFRNCEFIELEYYEKTEKFIFIQRVTNQIFSATF